MASSPDVDLGWTRLPRPRTYELVIERIEEQISAGHLKVGDRLPPERELAAALGVSRAAVREAIRVLDAMGTLVQSTGSGAESGTILSALPGHALSRLISLHVMLASINTGDVVRARIALERESVRLAATHATATDHARIAEHLAAMDDPGIAVAEFNEHDTAFHLAIARASGNVLVAELTTALRTAMRPTLLRALRAAEDFPAVAARLRRQHHGIYAAMVGADGTLAADRVQAHIDGFYADVPG